MNYSKATLAAAALALLSGQSLAADTTTTVTFDNGRGGWTGGNGTVIDTETSGNKHLRSVDETFGVHYTNNTNNNFLGDYTAHGTITLSVDVRIDKIDTSNVPDFFTSTPQVRSLVMDLRNTSFGNGGIFEYGAVILVLDNQLSSANNPEWQTFSVTFDPNQTELPAGWIGFGGGEDSNGDPILPAGATFADILSGVDEVSFSTFVPGEFYLQVFFDFSVDNFTITRNDTAACLPDLNGDGALDFFDISAFLTAFGNGDSGADFTGDGLFDFFDIAAFLSEFSAGCP